MTEFRNIAHIGFPAFRVPMAVIELLLALAMACLTALLWLSIGARAAPHQEAVPKDRIAGADGVVHVTLPPVVIVGHRSPSAAATAQNTAVLPITFSR